MRTFGKFEWTTPSSLSLSSFVGKFTQPQIRQEGNVMIILNAEYFVRCLLSPNIKYTWSLRRTQRLNRWRHSLHVSLVWQALPQRSALQKLEYVSYCEVRLSNVLIVIAWSQHFAMFVHLMECINRPVDCRPVDLYRVLCCMKCTSGTLTVIAHRCCFHTHFVTFLCMFRVAYARCTLMLSDNKPFRCRRIYTFHVQWVLVSIYNGPL